MKRFRWILLIAGTLTIASAALPASMAAASPAIPAGTVQVTIVTPDGVPANVELLAGSGYFAAKPPSGTSATVTLTLPGNSYQPIVRSFTYAGRFYTGLPSSPLVEVKPGKVTTLKVLYRLSSPVQDFHATSVGPGSISLAWAAPDGTTVAVRRSQGSVPPARITDGVPVPVSGSTAADQHLQPGTKYSYSLFALVRTSWAGPMTLGAGTAPQSGSGQAAYVANPATLIAKPGDVISASTTGSGVHAVLAASVPPPLIGAAVVLPMSDALPGGFLGVVTALSSDGHGIDLTAGGLSDAFDYYNVDIPDLSSTGPASAQAPGAAAAPAARLHQRAVLAPAAVPSCLGGDANKTVTFSPSITFAGHFSAKIDKFNALFASIPKGAALDMEFAVTLKGAISVDSNGDLNCGIPVKPFFQPIVTDPVPISIYINPTAEFAVSGSLKISNLGLTVTAGAQFSGHFGLTSGASFSGNPILQATPLVPKIVANGSIQAKVGGDLIIGPGAGTPDAGVIAGVSGSFYPLDASFGPVFPLSDSRYNTCLQTKAALTMGLGLTAKAWLGNWSVSKTVTLDALNGSMQYGGSPWYLPAGCKDAVEPDPTGDLLGSGVTKTGDPAVVGDPGQWGHIDGFAPGSKTWVLSTGLVKDATGDPSQFASTDLNEPGDPALSTLAGFSTFDAASYTVTVVPTGSTLHVKYVFASEEYPEYVGSAYNDVMAIFVNGVNCATVPGTGEPVSINTVNAGKNSQYYVDNSAGAAGYNTSMDGLTVPLTCSVAVKPGVATTVKIAVADTSDHIYDSAVALVDKGIWSD